MGNCVAAPINDKQKLVEIKFEDLQSQKQNNDEWKSYFVTPQNEELLDQPLTFEFTMSVLQIYNLPFTSGVRIECVLGDTTFEPLCGPEPKDTFRFSQQLSRTLTMSINQLKTQTFTVNLYKIVSGPSEKQLFSVYRVDLLTIAIGPIHHSIDLKNVKTGACTGKMTTNIVFTQIQEAKIELIECEAKILDSEAHVNLIDSYAVHFLITTFNEVFESTKSEATQVEQKKAAANSIEALTTVNQNKVLRWNQSGVTNFEDSEDSDKQHVAPNVEFKFSMVRLNDASFNLKIKFVEFETHRKMLANPKSPLVRGHTRIFNLKSELNFDGLLDPAKSKKASKVTFKEPEQVVQKEVVNKRSSILVQQKHIETCASEEVESYDDNFNLIKTEMKPLQLINTHFRNQSNSFSTPKTGIFGGFGGMTPTASSNKQVRRTHLIGECHMNFEHLIQHTISIQTIDNSKGIVFGKPQEHTFEQALWYIGHQIGTVSGLIRLHNMPFISQMKIGVLDNYGVHFSSKSYSMGSTAKVAKLKKVKQFETLKTKIIQHDRRIKHMAYEEISSTIAELAEVLNKSEKMSSLTFLYANQSQLIDMQFQLLELGNHILEFGEWTQPTLRPKYHEVMTLVLKRGELSLASLSLVSKDSTDKKTHARKLEIAADYELFIYKVLKKCILNLNMKCVEPYRKQFTETAITICFFHIPKFRAKFLSLIADKEGTVIRTQSVLLKRQSSNNELTILPQYNWQDFFYDQIPESKQKEAMKVCDEILGYDGEKEWQARFMKRGSCFFLVVKAWVEYVERSIHVVNEVEWAEIPGYTEIVAALTKELDYRDIVNQPDSLRLATVAFLCNARLLNQFVRIQFSKTPAYDVVAVVRTLDMTVQMILKIHRNKALIPPDFDYNFFFKGVRILANLDHGTSTAKLLWMLYQILHVIPKKERDQLMLELLSPENFYRFMFHWSFNIRMAFHYFYFFQMHFMLINDEKTKNQLQDSVSQDIKLIQESDVQGLAPDMPKINDLFAKVGSSSGGLKKSRLHGVQNDIVFEMFSQRMSEVITLRLLTKVINKESKQRKIQMYKQRQQEEIQIEGITRSIRKYRKRSDSLSEEQLTELSQYEKELVRLRQTTVDINVTHFASQPGFLTENQKVRWFQILEMIPANFRVYISISIKHLKGVMDQYDAWIAQGELNHKTMTTVPMNEQGILWMPDFPVVKIRNQEDEFEDFEQTQDW